MHLQRAWIESGGHQPEDVDVPHDGEDERDDRDAPGAPLEAMRQQQDERQGEVEEHDGERDPLPAAARAGEVPGNLLRQVAGPDDDELGQVEVRP